MGQGRLLSYFGILITLDIALWGYINVWWVFLLANLGWIFICVAVTLIENKLSKINKKWLDKLYYMFAKNSNGYTIKEKVIDYTLVNKKQAEHQEKVTLENNKEGHIKYHGKFSWPEQEEKIKIDCLSEDALYTDEDTKWTKVDITNNTFLKRGDLWETGFKLSNLHMQNFKRRSFLSVKTVDKIEKICLRVHIGSDLPKVKKEAVLRVEDAQGRILVEEPVYFNNSLNLLEKELCCLRLGRKYILVWDYESE